MTSLETAPLPGRSAQRAKRPDFISAIVTVVVMLLLVYIPFSEALNFLLDLKIFGYSALVTVIPTILALATLCLLALKRPQLAISALFLCAAAVIITLARIDSGIYTSGTSVLRGVTDVRFLILLPCYITLTTVACEAPWFRLRAPQAIVFCGLVQAVAGILYAVGLSNFRLTGVDEGIQTLVDAGYTTRAAGLFAGSNMYASFLVLCILMCIATRWRFLLRLIACVILAGGIVAAQSRFALAAAIIATVWGTWREAISGWARTLRFVLLVAALVLVPFLLRQSSDNVADRLTDDQITVDYDVRMDKAMLGLRATFGSLSTTLLGAKPTDLDVGDPTQSFSDNSYVAILSSVGLPLTVFFGIVLVISFQRIRLRGARLRGNGPFWFVVLSAALFNNAIYWDSWLYYMVVIYGLLAHTAVPVAFVSRRHDGVYYPRTAVIQEPAHLPQ